MHKKISEVVHNRFFALKRDKLDQVSKKKAGADYGLEV